jgi:major membrane immunogen (membrane-anchored lipoprotein)
MMKENMKNQEIDEESYNGSYKATKKNDSSHQWKATCKILLQSLSPTQFH